MICVCFLLLQKGVAGGPPNGPSFERGLPMDGITPKQALRAGSEFAAKLMASPISSHELQSKIDNREKMSVAIGNAVNAFISEQSPVQGPTMNDDGSITIRLKVDYDKTDEQCVAEAKAAGWWVNGYIRADRRIKVKGQTKKKGIHEVTVTLQKIVPSGTWKQDKITRALGPAGSDMDLHLLVALIPFRDALRKLGINWVYGWGARFRASDGDPCVAGLLLGARSVNLRWLEFDWYGRDWFGSVGR